MSWIYGDDYQYAHSRLAITLVRHNGKPFLVDEIRRDGMAFGIDMLEDKGVVVPAKELDCTPVPLGYVNHDAYGCVFVSRIPARRYRQGLSENTMHCIKNGGMAPIRNVSFRELNQCIMNEYPPMKDCLLAKLPRAWHRNWSSTAIKLYYKGEHVGSMIGGKPTLNKGYEYLQETLDEDCA